MKNVLKSLGKAAFYYLMFNAMYLIVFTIVGMAVSAQYMAGNSGQVDMTAASDYMSKAAAEANTLIVMISGVLFLVFLLVFFKARKKTFTSETVLEKLSVKQLVLPALLGISMYILFTMLEGFLPKDLMNQYGEAYGKAFSGNIVINSIAAVLTAPVVEEVVFRGVILSRLRRGMPAALAAIISSALFALGHGHILWMAYTFVSGLVLSFVCIKYRSVLASIAVHFIFNLAGLIVSVTGGIQDMSNGTAVLLLSLAAAGCAVLLVAIGRRKTPLQDSQAPATATNEVR